MNLYTNLADLKAHNQFKKDLLAEYESNEGDPNTQYLIQGELIMINEDIAFTHSQLIPDLN